MIVTCVYIRVKESFIESFKQACWENHLASVMESGNCRFDILQRRDNPASFLLYEAYETEEAANAHKETPHYRKWRDTVAGWMEIPREGVKYNALWP